ncbi:MAG: RNA polymerase sigma factor [Planctomycetaceae bacterium]
MMSESQEGLTDQQLVEALNSGDLTAFEAIYFRYRDWVMRLAFRLTGNHDDALDVLQETFTYLAGKFPGFVLTAAMTTFLYPAVRNLAIAANRKRRRSSGGDEVLEFFESPTSAPTSPADDIEPILTSLSSDHREILLMRFVDDLTQPEIAAALNIPLGTVKSRLHHAIQTLKSSPAGQRLLGRSDSG